MPFVLLSGPNSIKYKDVTKVKELTDTRNYFRDHKKIQTIIDLNTVNQKYILLYIKVINNSGPSSQSLPIAFPKGVILICYEKVTQYHEVFLRRF